MKKSITALAVLAFLGCGDDNDAPAVTPSPTAPPTVTATSTPAPTPTPGNRFVLGDGTVVRIDENGAISLETQGRETLAMAPGLGPRGSSFQQSIQSFGGLWVFERSEEESLGRDVFAGASRDGDNVVVLYESEDGSRTATVTIGVHAGDAATRVRVDLDDAARSVALPLRCDEQGGFYGFGEQYNATDQTGEAFTLFLSEQGIGRNPEQPILFTNGGPHTTYFPMPYYLDPRGFGVLVDTARRVNVDLCKSDPDVAWIELVGAGAMELLVFHGPTMGDVVRQLGDEVGRPTAPPDWAYGLWIGAQGGRDAIETEATALRENEVPAAVLWVQDWTGIRPNFGGGFGVEYRWIADPELYPDLAGLIADLKTQGFRFLAYVNPFIDVDLQHFPELEEIDGLIQDEAGNDIIIFAPNGESSLPAFTNPAAREYAQSFFRSMVEDLGIDGWMADFGEWYPLNARPFDGSDPVEAHNRYPIEWHRTWREVMDEVRPDGDWVVFARSGYTGVHRWSQIYWIGDQQVNFSPHDGLPTVVPAMLNLGISGIPFVTHDIAGFSSLGIPPRSKEVFLRWTELGAFTPIMRTHEGDQRDENWDWNSDAETIAHFRRFARIHDALAPDFMALAEEAAVTSMPILRHLMFVFPDDPQSRHVSDQFMIGESLLVAPVVEQGATTRRLYLPPGTWFDVWSGEEIAGGRTIEVDAPIGRPPVFSFGEDRGDLRAIE